MRMILKRTKNLLISTKIQRKTRKKALEFYIHLNVKNMEELECAKDA